MEAAERHADVLPEAELDSRPYCNAEQGLWGSQMEAIRSQEAAEWQKLDPTTRSRKAVIAGENGADAETVDLRHAKGLDQAVRRQLLDRAMETQDMDNELFLTKISRRLDRAGVVLPEVELVFRDLTVSADAFVATRALPSLPNYFQDILESGLNALRLMKPNKQRLSILKGVSGRIQPGRFTLLLGPPGCGKSTLLKALAGKLQGSSLQVGGEVLYNGYELDEFVIQSTSAYIEQSDNAIPALTVRQTLDFAARCQGAAFGEIEELRAREKELGIEPDWEIDAIMKAAALEGKEQHILTDYVMRILGLEVCADTIVGDQLVRGISGGQRKRVTTGEMLVSSKRVLLADEISTGLDSSTTYLIVKCFRNMVHLRRSTVLMSLLQPPPETFALFDDVMLLSEGHLVYHGPVASVLEFFEELGFQLPARKGVADFLQEVTSRKDQRQFWKGNPRAYRYVTPVEMAASFAKFHVGAKMGAALDETTDRTAAGKAALAGKRFALTWYGCLKACMRRELILMQANRFLFYFRLGQVALVAFMVATLFIKPRMSTTTLDGGQLYLNYLFFSIYFMVVTGFSELAISVGALSVFYKQRDNNFFPVTAFALPTTIVRIPYSLISALCWVLITYFSVGMALSVGRFFVFALVCFLMHTIAVSQFRAISSIARQLVLANIAAFLIVLLAFLFGGLVIAKRDVPPWWRWAVYISPMYYGQYAISINEFHAPRWSSPSSNPPSDLGREVLNQSDLDGRGWWVGLSIALLLIFIVFYNAVICGALKLLSSPDQQKAVIPASALPVETSHRSQRTPPVSQKSLAAGASQRSLAGGASQKSMEPVSQKSLEAARLTLEEGKGVKHVNGEVDQTSDCEEEEPEYGAGLTLPFKPMLLTFLDISYFVEAPGAPAPVSKDDCKEPASESARRKDELQLLDRICGVFRPGVLTALMGASGAGKTTLMDVLSGRKTSGRWTGDIRVNGFQQDLQTFKRVSGYCEQFDIHSPQSTVGEALWFSARTRLAPDVSNTTMNAFIAEVMELVELTPLKDALVGKPGLTGLSVEQRKRLTIAVELVANPSIVFMDEPTSGLDARAAAIVMRTVRNIVNTGRTIACTIHQPSIDIFEAFDELLLLKRGGVTIYAGKLGRFSQVMVDYFESIDGVPPLAADFNPATWMLDISTISAEQRLGCDLAAVYRSSSLYRQNREFIEERAQPAEGASLLTFETSFSQPLWRQYCYLLAKNSILYWRNPDYTGARLVFTFLLALGFGTALWQKGDNRSTREDLIRVAAAQYLVVVFFGFTNAATAQPVVSIERIVFYRERFAGMYSSVPFALAQGDVEWPYLILQSLIYSSITYWCIGYEASAAKFWLYTLFMFLSLSYYTFYGMMVVSLTSTISMASTVSVIAYAVWNLMAGFILPYPSIPKWYQWVALLNPAHWSLYGLVVAQLGDVQETVQGLDVTTSQFIESYYGFRHSFTGCVVAILIAFIVFFRAVTVYALCRLQFGKR